MVLETITERGILSKESCVVLSSTNNVSYNAAEGTTVSATASTITLNALHTSSSFEGKVIEIISGTGQHQIRIIQSMSSNVATLTSKWGIIPDTTSIYVIHEHSGICPEQPNDQMIEHITLNDDASTIEDFYTGAYMKLVGGNGKDQIFMVIDYHGSTRMVHCFPRPKLEPINNTTMYIIYGEGGTAASGTSTTITTDSNQTDVVKAKHYIEIHNGTGRGQIRMISSISGDVITVTPAWTTTPDSTSKYNIYGGWGSSGYENVLRQAVITVASAIGLSNGEKAILGMSSALDVNGSSKITDLTELSSQIPSRAHAITVISQFFRLKIVGMGTALNGTIQTIFNSYKSGKVTSKMEEMIHGSSDCELTRAVIAGKTIGDEYCNIRADSSGNLSTTIKNPTDGFGSLVVTQPRQFAEVTFLNNYSNPATVVTQTLSSGAISVANNICSISSGTSADGRASMFSARRMRYNPGLAINIRFTAIFSTPIADSIQIAGYGDVCDGLFVGYNGLDFGILFRRGGKTEMRRLTVTAVTTTNDNIQITLNGATSSSIAILTTDNTQQIARKIAATSFATVGTGWDAYEESGNTVLFISRVAGSLSGSYSYTATYDSTGSFSSVETGVAATDTWISQTNWNKDRALGLRELPYLYPTHGNVYEIGMQWLGFGNITFKVEHPLTGTFYEIHQIRYSNMNTVTSLLNPNLPMCVYVEKTGANAVDAISVQTASMGLFVMGDNNKTLGPRMGISNSYYTGSGSLTAGTYYNVLTLRNMQVFANSRNYNEVFSMAVTFCLNGGTSVTRGGIFTFFLQGTLSNSSTLTWTKRNQYTSSVEYCTDVVSVSGGSEMLSIACSPNHSVTLPLADFELYIPPGVSIVCAFKPFVTMDTTAATAADITISASWVQR